MTNDTTTDPHDLDAMNDTTTDPHDLPRPGDQVHFLAPITFSTKANSFTGAGATLNRGDTITITADIIEAQRDRHGDLSRSWVALLHDEDAQVARFGQVVARPGSWPEDQERWTYGDRRWETERDNARRAAWAIADDADRAAALAAVEERFGPSRQTSKTTAVYRPGQHPTEIQARQQERRFAADRASGVR
jgi:hypothetical protein